MKPKLTSYGGHPLPWLIKVVDIGDVGKDELWMIADPDSMWGFRLEHRQTWKRMLNMEGAE